MAFQSARSTPVGKMAIGLGGLTKSYLGTSVHKAGMRGAAGFLGIAKGMSRFNRTLGVGFALYEAATGYGEGGVTGAVGNLAELAATGYAFDAGLKILGMGARFGLPIMAATAIAGGVLAGRAAAAHIGKERYRKHARLEMGTPVLDQFGSIATMRQRSLQALNNSRLNGMTALGNEASLLYRPYAR